MPHFRQQAGLGLRWLTCGLRLFRRDPWRLAAMGAMATALLAALVSIPLIGPPLAGFFFPALLGALYLALDATAVRSTRPPARMQSLKAAPRAFAAALAGESRLLLIVILGLGGMAASLLAAMLAWQVAGSAWWLRPEPDLTAYARAAAGGVLALIVCSAAAAVLAYVLPLALLREAPLADAGKYGVRAAVRHAGALAVLEAVVLAPLLAGAIVGWFTAAPGAAVALAGSVLALPVVAAALYCSYRTLFPVPQKAPPARARAAGAPARATRPAARGREGASSS